MVVRPPNLLDVERERCKRSMYYFVKRAWEHVEPAIVYQDNWHIEHVCEHLRQVRLGNIRNLILNQPPGSSKSLLVSVFFNAWLWSIDPSKAFIYTSFDSSLTHRDAEKVRTLMASKWYQRLFGGLVKLDPNEPGGEFNTFLPDGSIAGGWRFSSSVGGKTTGRHPDIRVIDDPTKPLEATPENLEKTWQWWQSTMRSRARDPGTVQTILIMQRLAESDLAGKFLESDEGFLHVRIPLMFDGEPYETPYRKDPRTKIEESFWTSRYTPEVCATIKRGTPDIGVWSSQWQNRPAPATGIIFDTECFQLRYVEPPSKGITILSFDFSFKGETTSDWCAGGAWRIDGPEIYLLYAERKQLDFVSSLGWISGWIRDYPGAEILIEDKANGPAIISTIKDKVGRITPINPGSDSKVTRAKASRASYGSKESRGNVHFPESAPWLHDYITEHLLFPRGKNDDFVDMASQLINYVSKSGTFSYAGVDTGVMLKALGLR